MNNNNLNTRGLYIPFTRMGAVTSHDLFEPREQALFDLYEAMAATGRYSRALDIGANIGVHTLLMARHGWEVRAYEPDPKHYRELWANVHRNLDGRGHGEVQAFKAAVSTATGVADFVRVLGNTTASHLRGARDFHGDVERFHVSTVDGRLLWGWADFAKIDCEGHEAALLCTVTDEACDFLVEVGSADNAKAIYEHFSGKRPMWAQGLDWAKVTGLDQMPTHYSHGSLFIGERP